MPVTFRILPRFTLVLVTYAGCAGLDETIRGARACAADPAFRPSMRHLVDLRAVTGWERDFAGFMAMQAQLAGIFGWHRSAAMVVAIAPHAPAREMAGLVTRSWDGLTGPALRMALDEEQALSMLGLPEGSLADLLARVG